MEPEITPIHPTMGTPGAPRDLTGEILDDYKVLKLLGRGGMGEVYLAEQISLKRPVAVKVLRQDLVADEKYLLRFQAEAKTVAPINHPNIVAVLAIGQARGVHYIVLEYVQGMNLREYLARKGRVELGTGLLILRKVALALQRAGEEGIVHRDIKPENILLTKKNEVKVADFGLVRMYAGEDVSLTQSGVTMGTPLYMSPEQVEGKPLDPRSDLYSLGVMSYHMFAGEPPFRGETAMAVAVQHVNTTPRPLSEHRSDLPPDLIRIIEKLMAKSPADRYPSCRELLRDLTDLRQRLNGSGPLSAQAMSDSAVSRVDVTAPTEAMTAPTFFGRLAQTWRRPGVRRTVLVATVLVACVAGGVAGRISRRGNPLARADAQPRVPDYLAIERRPDGWSQLRHATIVLPSAQREAGLWAVLKFHPGDEDRTIEAALHLIKMYGDRRSYQQAALVGEELVARDDARQKMVGFLLRGIVESRQRHAAESMTSFLNMRDASRQARRVPLDPQQLEILAREYFVALERNWELLGVERDPQMARIFWDFFVSRSPSRSASR